MILNRIEISDELVIRCYDDGHIEIDDGMEVVAVDHSDIPELVKVLNEIHRTMRKPT